MEDHLKDYRFSFEMEVAWGEMDAFSHVNNIYFFRYFENARIRYFDRMKMFDPSQGPIGPILAATQCKYIRPITFPDRLKVGARVTSVSEDRFTMNYLILGLKENEVKALGEAVIVAYDHHHKNKVQLPQEWKKEISLIEGRAF